MIGAALWAVGYLMIAASIYLYTRDVFTAAVVPLVAQLLITGLARIAAEMGVVL